MERLHAPVARHGCPRHEIFALQLVDNGHQTRAFDPQRPRHFALGDALTLDREGEYGEGARVEAIFSKRSPEILVHHDIGPLQIVADQPIKEHAVLDGMRPVRIRLHADFNPHPFPFCGRAIAQKMLYALIANGYNKLGVVYGNTGARASLPTHHGTLADQWHDWPNREAAEMVRHSLQRKCLHAHRIT